MSKRISEEELKVPTLRLLAAAPQGRMSTASIKEQLVGIMKPSGEDLAILKGRKDTKFTQKVRNIVSHRPGANSLVSNGLADYDPDLKGLVITEKGRALLDTLRC